MPKDFVSIRKKMILKNTASYFLPIIWKVILHAETGARDRLSVSEDENLLFVVGWSFCCSSLLFTGQII